MEHTVSVENMRYSDAWTIKNKIDSKELMYRAGVGIFQAAEWKPPAAIICGKGNNAGDGYVVAELMRQHGIPCTIFLLSDRFSEDGKYYYDICKAHGIPTEVFSEATKLDAYGSILDCILGTGFKGDVKGVTKTAIDAINRAHAEKGVYVVSADINSGLNGNSGTGETFVYSDLTVSIGTYKHGHFRGYANQAMKARTNVDIGIEIQPVRAVLFDLDGTLIDTEKLFRIFWPAAFRSFGHEMTDEQELAIRSLGRPFVLDRFREWFGDSVDYHEVRRKRKELMDAYIAEHGVELKPGAVELLKYLQEQGIITAVVTASDLTRTSAYLESLGVREYFTKLISATQVEKGKPAPDVYLYACSELGLSPDQCLAVEDSPNGVQSAYRAGCRVVMVPDLSEPERELQTLLFARADTLADIIDMIDDRSCRI